ncbi:hypothetical protein [Cloacibacterium sp.]|uniref:hypothetical protein n=1 Tax=Cloacibacterium sp. TaxID=1913682 RepID=UPI0039E71C4A
MTLQQVLGAIEEFGNNNVLITLTDDRTIRGILQNAYAGHQQDPRGYTEPYFFVVRIDLTDNPTEKYNCEEILSIVQIN